MQVTTESIKKIKDLHKDLKCFATITLYSKATHLRSLYKCSYKDLTSKKIRLQTHNFKKP